MQLFVWDGSAGYETFVAFALAKDMEQAKLLVEREYPNTEWDGNVMLSHVGHIYPRTYEKPEAFVVSHSG